MNKEFELKDGQVYLPMSVNCYKAVKAATDAYYAFEDWSDDEMGTEFAELRDMEMRELAERQYQNIREIMALWSEKFLIDYLDKTPVRSRSSGDLSI